MKFNSALFNALLKAIAVCLLLTLCSTAYSQQRLAAFGGGSRPPEAIKTFVRWSGGLEANILVITWASEIPDESFDALKKDMLSAGNVNVAHAQTRPITAENKPELIKQIKNATGIFFSGGDQNRIMDILQDKELYSLLVDKYHRGIPVGGTSAGAAIMSDPMMNGEADLKKMDITNTPTASGLGLLPDSIIDQHFLLRQRHNRLFSLMLKYPARLGIGIDEDMAILVENNNDFQVFGPTRVMFATSNSDGSFKVSFLSSGERYIRSAAETAR